MAFGLAGCGGSNKPDPEAAKKLQEKLGKEGYPTRGPRTPGGMEKPEQFKDKGEK
jgi:hypothetical protein